jgi:hypothetical protein
MNRDTLYAGAVVDTEGGATVTIPEFPDGRYFSVYVVDNDHYAAAVFYELVCTSCPAKPSTLL